jgi:uncharacterized protein
VSERLPSKRKALRLLFEAGCSPAVIEHCKAVAAVATKIARACEKKELNVDIQLVEIGALLHDIGRSRTHSVNHAVVGMEIAKSLGLPDKLVSVIGRHVGGGITVNEAERLGWPVKSYVPQTLEEKIVAYADKLIEGLRRVPIEQTLEKFSRELGETHPAIERVKSLHAEISSIIGDFDADTHVA